MRVRTPLFVRTYATQENPKMMHHHEPLPLFAVGSFVVQKKRRETFDTEAEKNEDIFSTEKNGKSEIGVQGSGIKM